MKKRSLIMLAVAFILSATAEAECPSYKFWVEGTWSWGVCVDNQAAYYAAAAACNLTCEAAHCSPDIDDGPTWDRCFIKGGKGHTDTIELIVYSQFMRNNCVEEYECNCGDWWSAQDATTSDANENTQTNVNQPNSN